LLLKMASALEIRWARVFWAALLVALANFWLLVIVEVAPL
jgi:hypothetical protein